MTSHAELQAAAVADGDEQVQVLLVEDDKVLQRFERRLEGLVEGAFARAFGGVVQPVGDRGDGAGLRALRGAVVRLSHA